METVRQRVEGGRLYHLLCLIGLLILGLAVYPAGLEWSHVLVILATALVAQRAWTPAGQRFHWQSAASTGLLLCLLLRSEYLWLAGLAALVAISSKFLFRRARNRLRINPALIGLATVTLLNGAGTVDPGVWGVDVFVGLGLLLAVGLVLFRPGAAVAVVAFLTWYAFLQLGAAAIFDGTLVGAATELQSATLLIIGFYIAGDTKSLPSSFVGRFLFALAAAALAAAIGAWATQGTALVVALLTVSSAVPLIERLYPAPRRAWTRLAVSSYPRAVETRRD